MFENSGKRRRIAVSGIAFVAIAFGVIEGCGGKVGGFGGHAEFAYLATGTNIIQFNVAATGQLTELIPNTAPSVNAVAIATTADNRFAYAANASSGEVSQYSISGDGLLHPLNPATAPAGAGADSVVVTPDAKFVYVLNRSAASISQFSISGNGTLTPLSTATVGVAPNGITLAITPNGKYVYAASFPGTLSAYSVGVDGQLTPLAVPTYAIAGPSGQAVSPNGNFLYVPMDANTVAQFSIALDGSLSPLNPATITTPGVGNDAVAFTPNGAFAYVGEFNGGFPASPVAQFSIGGDGTLTPLAPATVPAGNAPESITVDPAGKFAYVCNSNDGSVSEFSIGVDGTLTALIPGLYNTNGALQIAFARK